VGVSVVNALSKHLETWVRRGGKEYNIAFKNGKVHSKLEVVGEVGKNNTGTTVRFWPDPSYFDTPRSRREAQARVKAKAVLCPGLEMKLAVEKSGESETWQYSGGSSSTCVSRSNPASGCPTSRSPAPSRASRRRGLGGRVAHGRRCPPRGELRQPDPDHAGRHARQWFPPRPDRSGAEFCEFRNLLPRGLKLSPEDVWDDTSFGSR